MLQDPNQPERPVAMATGPIAGAGAAQGEGTVTLPRLRAPGLPASLPRPRFRVGRRTGQVAIAMLLVGTFAVVAAAAGGPSILVPRSNQLFPNWEAGPLHDVFSRLIDDPQTLGLAFSGVVVLMTVAYGLALGAVRTMSMRTIAIVVVLLHVILLMSPPLQLTDLFNYLAYSRLGALHHLNPYTHVIKQEFFDPVYQFTSWHNLKSPYGPLFTAFSYPLAFMSLSAAYWTTKVATVLLSLGFVAIVWQCARQLGRDPRFAVVFVAFNPIFLLYAVAGFHNDFFMLVASTGAISLLLGRHDRTAGAALMIAVAIKFTAIVLLPFLLLGARTRARVIKVLVGAGAAAIPLAALTLVLFGLSIPNLSDQSSLLTDFSIPNIFGLLIGAGGGAPWLLRVATVGVVAMVGYQVYRRRDWLNGAGWSTLALIASLAWLVPWYVIWLLPLAALGTSVALRRLAIVLTVYLVLAFMPATAIYTAQHGINLLSSPVGQHSSARQHKLAF
jgi:hypothetical protein